MKHIAKSLAVVGAVPLVLYLSACAQTGNAPAVQSTSQAAECVTPFPEGMQISTPSADTQAEFARYVGAWGEGMWDGKLCHTLVVESVNSAGRVSVVYSVGAYPDWNITQPNFYRALGAIEGDRLTLERFGNGAQATYWFDGANLKGTYTTRSGETANVTLSEVTLPLQVSTGPALAEGLKDGPTGAIHQQRPVMATP